MTFVPKSWLPFVLSGEDKVSRWFWALALLWRLRDRTSSYGPEEAHEVVD
jgi:hypothetical protein